VIPPCCCSCSCTIIDGGFSMAFEHAPRCRRAQQLRGG
jgi:hypothetical protein